MSKLQVKIDGEWQDFVKIKEVNYKNFEWEKDKTYVKEPIREIGVIDGTIDTEIELAELTKPKCFALIEEAYINLLYKAKAIHCVGENDHIYYEWKYETLESNVPLPHDTKPCYEKGRVTVKYKIVRAENKGEIFDRTFKKFTSGEFGNPEK